MTKDMLVQIYIKRLASVEDLIVLLEENPARNPEFDFDGFRVDRYG